MSGKKKGKAKWKPVAVSNLLADNTVSLSKPSWNQHQDDDHGNAARKHQLPTAPRAVRGSEDERVPKDKPYLAYLSNLPYEISEEEIVEHFSDLKIVNVRLPRRDMSSRGFGYVEFEERNGLVEALAKSDLYMKGRTIRIDVAQEVDRGQHKMGRDRMDRGDRDRDRGDRERDDDPERTMGDWRSAPRPEPSDDRGGGRPGRGYGSSFGGREEGFGSREVDNREGGWRESSGADRPPRDRFGGDRRGGFGERDRFGDRDRDRDRDFDRGRFGDRDRDRDFAPRRNYDDEGYRRRDDDGPPPSSEPRTRPKIVLEPRQVPLDPPPAPPPAEADPEAAPAAPPVPRASIFGAAKPVDTAAREREIEERLAKQQKDRPRARSPEKRSDDPPKEERPKRVDAQASAPAPKENVWSRRQAGATDNGVSNRDSEHERPSSAKNSHDEDDRNESYRDSNSNRGDYREKDSYLNSESGRGGYRDRDSGSYRDSDRRSGYRDDEGRAGYRDSSRGKDYRDSSGGREPYRDSERERDGGRAHDRAGYRTGERGSDRSGYRDSERIRDDRSNHSSSERGRTYKDGDDAGKDDQPPASDRPPRSRDRDDPTRMPKYREAEVPNFAGSNKFANLPDGDDY